MCLCRRHPPGTVPTSWFPGSVPFRWRTVVSGDPPHQHTGITRMTVTLGWMYCHILKSHLPPTQGLLKVAVENARVQDKQIQAEKRELKMELYREREMRESLERQLTSELQSRGQTLRITNNRYWSTTTTTELLITKRNTCLWFCSVEDKYSNLLKNVTQCFL